MGGSSSAEEQQKREEIRAHEIAKMNVALKAENDTKLTIKREELAQLKMEAQKPKPHRVWVGERQRIQIALAEYKAFKDNTGKTLVLANEKIAEQKGAIAEYEVKHDTIVKLVNEFNKAKLLEKEIQEYNECKANFDECKNEINAMIDKTCVNRKHMGYFLKLTQNIIPTVLKSVQQSSELDADFEAFHEILERQCSDQLSIATYFGPTKLVRFVQALVKQDFLLMEDIECDDEEEFTEDILQVLESAVSEAQRQWKEDKQNDDQAAQPALANEISKSDKRKLGKLCYKKTGTDAWKKAQKNKVMVTHDELSKLAPVMVLFFERLDGSLKKALKLLEFGSELNNAQQGVMKMKAIEAAESQPTIDDVSGNSNSNSKNSKIKPIVEFPDASATTTASTAEEKEKEEEGENGNADDNDDDSKQMANGDCNTNSNSNSNSNSNNSTVVKTNTDTSNLNYVRPEIEAEPVQMLVSDFITASEQNNSLCEVALRSIDVISTMEEELISSGNGKIFAAGIQNTCEKIVESQSNLRRNIAFAMEIAKMKPAHMTANAEKTWKCIDESCLQIYKSTIEVWKVSAKYFSFFARFQQSFGRYISCMRINSECEFVVSLEFLRRDIREFLAFKNEYSKVLMSLNEEAIGCISNCVTEMSGSTSYEDSTKNFDNAQKAYSAQTTILRAAEKEADKEYCALKERESVCAAELAKAKYLLKTYQEMTQSGAQANCEAEIAKLQKQLVTAVDYKTEYK